MRDMQAHSLVRLAARDAGLASISPFVRMLRVASLFLSRAACLPATVIRIGQAAAIAMAESELMKKLALRQQKIDDSQVTQAEHCALEPAKPSNASNGYFSHNIRIHL